MKWTTGVDFTNIWQASFLYESVLRSFYVLLVRVCTFCPENIGKKAAFKILVKLTTSVNFTNSIGFCNFLVNEIDKKLQFSTWLANLTHNWKVLVLHLVWFKIQDGNRVKGMPDEIHSPNTVHSQMGHTKKVNNLYIFYLFKKSCS